jgi:hypothetical protein
VPSGSWRDGGVTWTFTENPGNESGETWFFYGSPSTSKKGGGASFDEQFDWGNLCNWYSSKTTSPSISAGIPLDFDKRATRLPPENAVVHIYSPVSKTPTGPATVKHAYFWGTSYLVGSAAITATSAAFDSELGCVFNDFSSNYSTVNGGAMFNNFSANGSVVNGRATFNDASFNSFVINGGATFNDFSQNLDNAVVNDGATFNNSSKNWDYSTVNGGATFNDSSQNLGQATVNGGATFNDSSQNVGFPATVNGGAVFNNSSQNRDGAVVNGGATFNDSACSTLVTLANGLAIFAANSEEAPICNGSAPTYANRGSATCGCG